MVHFALSISPVFINFYKAHFYTKIFANVENILRVVMLKIVTSLLGAERTTFGLSRYRLRSNVSRWYSSGVNDKEGRVQGLS